MKIREFCQLIATMWRHICILYDTVSTSDALQMVVAMSGVVSDELSDDYAEGEGGQSEEVGEVNDELLDYPDDRKENIELLVEEAARFHARLQRAASQATLTAPVTLSKFMNEIMLARKSDPTMDAVSLATVHQMKGLEAPICFLMRFNQGVLPVNDLGCDGMALEIPHRVETLEEERRVAYVAMTRAKKRLFISLCRLDRKERAEMQPSQFLAEIEPRCRTSMRLTEDEQNEVRKLMAYIDDDFDDISPLYSSPKRL
jgi:DNA helicase-2/ATP-dependent DNA helicase PcrA